MIPFEFLITKTLVKVLDRNSFRANQNYTNSFRYLYPSQCESFGINPKNVLYLVWWKTVKNLSDLIRFNPRQQSETKFSIRINPSSDLSKSNFKSELIRMNPRSEWCGLIVIKNSVWVDPSSDWIGLKTWLDRFFTVFHQTRYKTFFGLVRIQISEWIGIVLIGSEWIPIQYFRQGIYRFHSSQRFMHCTWIFSTKEESNLRQFKNFIISKIVYCTAFYLKS